MVPLGDQRLEQQKAGAAFAVFCLDAGGSLRSLRFKCLDAGGSLRSLRFKCLDRKSVV